jgi:cytochrome oxidase assembly protein ShyY1
MKETVAVNHWSIAAYERALKRQALMFDRILVGGLNVLFSRDAKEFYTRQQSEQLRRNLESVLVAGILLEPTETFEVRQDESDKDYKAQLRHLGEFARLMGLNGKRQSQESNQQAKSKTRSERARGEEIWKKANRTGASYHIDLFVAYQTRCFSNQLRTHDGLDTFPILQIDPFQLESVQSHKSHVLDIVLRSLPLPDDGVSWEQIVEYRSDPDSKAKFLDLRHWMSEVARGELTASEVEEKLEYLLSRYRRHLEVHKMKSNTTMFETVVVTTADVLGNLASFQWGKAAQALFSLKHRKVALLEGELTAEGNEVAYIMKTRDAFYSKTN